jgi:hypothetical protein
LLAGDLDKIILKALRKTALERYQTAAELSADINSYLEKRPLAIESVLRAGKKAGEGNLPKFTAASKASATSNIDAYQGAQVIEAANVFAAERVILTPESGAALEASKTAWLSGTRRGFKQGG